jgi:hypothetical protein
MHYSTSIWIDVHVREKNLRSAAFEVGRMSGMKWTKNALM